MATVAGVFVKPRVAGEYGLPKHLVDGADVLASGLRDDYNNYRQEELHGDPDSAVLLLTEGILETLRSEGWPVRPGDLGENLLLRGVAYDELAPRRELQVGGELRLATTRACDPCRRLETLPYVGEEKGPDFRRTMLGRRGWYARVIRPGRVQVGDAVELV